MTNMKPRNIASLTVVVVVRTFARQLNFFLLHTREVIRNQRHIAVSILLLTAVALLFDPHTLVSVARSLYPV